MSDDDSSETFKPYRPRDICRVCKELRNIPYKAPMVLTGGLCVLIV